jgi:N-acetyl-anhydromuramyl-L-alanine amidase AmpD
MQQLKTVNFSKRDLPIIDMVIIHYTEVSMAKTIEIFQDPNAKVSSHYMIGKKGGLYQFVREEDKAWHAGDSYWQGRTALNNNSIGIEIVNDGKSPYTNKQVASLITLLRDLVKRYNIQLKNILGHSDIAPLRKDDPGILFPWQKLAEHNLAYYPKSNIAQIDNVHKETFSRNHVIFTLQEIGYKIDEKSTESELSRVIYKFCIRYMQERVGTIWNKYSNAVAEEIIKKIEK